MTNQFHYYRLTADNRILWGGYDAIYHFGRHVRPSLRPAAGDVRPARPAVLRDVPAARGAAVQPPLGRRDRHLHPLLRLLRHGVRRPRGVRPRLHRPRRRRHPVRRRRDARPARRRATPSGPALQMVRSQAAAVPARAVRLGRHRADPVVARRRRPQRRPAQPVAADPRPAGAGFRLADLDPPRSDPPRRHRARRRPGGRRGPPARPRVERRRLPGPALARRDPPRGRRRRSPRRGGRLGRGVADACSPWSRRPCATTGR